MMIHEVWRILEVMIDPQEYIQSTYKNWIHQNDIVFTKVLQAITTHEDNALRESFSKKFSISMEIVNALQNYVKMLHTCETIYDDLTAKLDELENNTEPERERLSTNPFTLSVPRGHESSHPSSSPVKVETPIRGNNAPREPLPTTSNMRLERLDSFERLCSSTPSNDLDISSTPTRQERATSTMKVDETNNQSKESLLTKNPKVKVRSDLKERNLGKTPRPPPELHNSCERNDKTDTPNRGDTNTILTQPERTRSADVDSTTNKIKSETQSNSKESQGKTSRPLPEIPKRSEKVPRTPNQQVKQENCVDSSKVECVENKTDTTSVSLPRPDWREEAVRKLENKSLKKTVQWAPALTQTETVARNEVDKKPKGKNVVSNIAEGNLKVNQNCIICYVESPSEFYVRTDQALFESFENRFNEDMNKQYQYVVNKFKSKRDAKTNLGNFCFGFMSTRRKWYRIEVLDWMEHEIDKIFVQLIDYGERMYWDYKHLKAMADLYGLFAKMAIKCHLAGIYSPNLDGTKKWPKASVDYFMEISELATMTQFVMIFVHKEGNSYAVDLRTTKDKNADTLGELLVKNNHAFEVKISQDRPFHSEDEDEFDNINEAVAGYDAQDECRMCPFTDESGGCFKGASCTLEHGILSSDGITTDKVLTINQAVMPLELPPAGDIIHLLITGYVDTCHFYAQILEEPSSDELFNGKFVRLMDAMQANNVVQTYEPFKIYPGIGEIVLAKNEGKWWRGRCVGYMDNECLEVFLVDVGYTVIRKLKELRVMKEEFSYLPFQAVECILDNCQEKKDASRTHSRKFFDSVMNMKMFTGHVMESTSETLRLQLSDAEEMDMSHVLKQWGLGEDRDKNFYPAPDCSIGCE